MSKILFGILCGTVFGLVSAASMIPLKLEDKKTAMAGAFANRFAIGFVISITDLPLPMWINGLLLGSLLSLPDAIITKAWVPIMALGAIGGILCGVAVDVFVS